MNFIGTDSGRVERKKPSRIRQALEQGSMEFYDRLGANNYYFWLYAGDPERTAQAGCAIAAAFQEDQENQRILWEEETEIRQELQEAAQRAIAADFEAFRKRVRRHERELLQHRGLPMDTPLKALALPFERKREHLESRP